MCTPNIFSTISKIRLLKLSVIIITKNRGKEKHFPERLATMLVMLFANKMYETHYIL